MHELSLAQGLVKQLLQLATEHHADRVVKATVRIGPLAGVVVDSFCFGFDAVKSMSSVTRETILELDCPPAVYRCPACGWEGEVCRPANVLCPGCGIQGRTFPVGDDDLILQQVELEGDDETLSGSEQKEGK
ncbi:MAG: hydrogenase maturation nickel metallochaperone HypA [Deltaproteobacteria bacterium]|nr:MAG: hydrogenase maturation nickel metallochaperone HypA [Deltaproteobacteria bacterium]